MSLRPHRLAPWATASVLLATVVTAPGVLAQAPEEACAKGRRVQVKPQELKKKVRGATSREELKKLLDSLGMTVDWSGLSCTQEAAPSVVLDVFKARLFSAEQQDLVVQARGSVCEGVRLLSGVVLHPLAGKDTWCAIAMPFLPGLPEEYHRKTVFGFVNLTDPVRQVFKVDSEEGHPRHTSFDLSYWEFQQGELRSIFGITSNEYSGFTHGASIAKVTPQGTDFPRQLLIKESTSECGKFVDMPSGDTVYTSDCTEVSNEQRQCYQRDPRSGRTAYAECPSSPYGTTPAPQR